jgi:TRAP-type C4-dicarboxylate transport system permease small subunit
MWVACTLLALMVAFTIYTVVMRYVFKNPPFWGDTVSLFCNIWLVLIAYALAVRDREDIATEGIYGYLSPRAIAVLRFSWQALTLAFGLYLIWYGMDAALNVPGQFWELGGLPKTYPMLALPVCGVLVTYATAINVAEDIFGWRDTSEPAVPLPS